MTEMFGGGSVPLPNISTLFLKETVV